MGVPYTFTNGTIADATQVNANFDVCITGSGGGTVTSPLIVNSTSTFNDPVTVNSSLTTSSGITYSSTEGHVISFGWDGTNLIAHVDGTGTPGALAALNSAPTFSGNVTSGGQVSGASASFSGNLTSGGTVTGVTGSFSGNVTSGGAGSFSGNMTAGGTVSGAAGSFTGSITTGGVVSGGSATFGGTVSGGSATFSGAVSSSGRLTCSADFILATQNINAANDIGAQGAFRRSAGGLGITPKGAKIECFDGSDDDTISFAVISALFYVSPDEGVSGWFFTPTGTFSDERLKTGVVDTSVDALSALMATPVRAFAWTEEGLTRQPKNTPADVSIGLVAQELQAHMPEAVGSTALAGNFLYIDSTKLTPYFLRAIQQQQEMIQALTTRVAALEAAAAPVPSVAVSPPAS